MIGDSPAVERQSATANKEAIARLYREIDRGRYDVIEELFAIVQSGIVIYRFAAGRIVERWSEQDRLGLLDQLGLITSREAR